MRGAAGRGGRVKTLRGLQELLHNSACGFLHAKNYAKRLCKSLFQSLRDIYYDLARRAGVRRMTESALPARLKLSLKRQRPRGGVWGGDRCGEARQGHGDDGKRASSAIEVERQASATQGRGLGGGIAAGSLGRVMGMTESALPA